MPSFVTWAERAGMHRVLPNIKLHRTALRAAAEFGVRCTTGSARVHHE